MREFLRDRGKKIRHLVCRNDYSLRGSSSLGQNKMANFLSSVSKNSRILE